MAEKEYIEREAVMLQINIADFVRDDNYEAGATLLFQDDVVDRISSIPAADVRPVVLCRDCRHRDPEDHKCDSGEMERQGCPFKVADNYFCAYGER